MENLRSKCVYEYTLKNGNSFDKSIHGQWFRYMYAMNTLVLAQGELTKSWSTRVLEQIGISPQEINLCVNNSFAEPGNYQSENRFLKEDRWW